MSLEFTIDLMEKKKFCKQVVFVVEFNNSEALVFGLLLGVSELVKWLVRGFLQSN